MLVDEIKAKQAQKLVNLKAKENFIVEVEIRGYPIYVDQMRRTQVRGVINTFEHILHSAVCNEDAYNGIQAKRFPQLIMRPEEYEMMARFKTTEGKRGNGLMNDCCTIF